MRRKTNLLIGFWVVLGLIIIAVIAIGLAPTSASASVNTDQQGGGNMQTYVDETLSVNSVNKIELLVSAAKTTIHHSEDDDFRVVQRGQNLTDGFILIAEKSGSSIKVHTKSNFHFSFFNLFLDPLPKNSYVDIYIPASYAADLNVSLSAGDLAIEGGYDVDQLDLHVSAGGLSSSSKLAAKNANLSVSAGDLELDTLEAERFKLSTSAGGLNIYYLTGSGNISASAGSIELNRVDITDTLDVRASAGSIIIGIAGDPGLDFTASSSAGSVTTYFGAVSSGLSTSTSRKVGEAPYKKLSVSTSAGSVEIVRAD